MPENDTLKPVGELVPIGKTSQKSNVKPVGELTPIGKTSTPRILDFSQTPLDDPKEKTIEIINSLPEMSGDTESKKEILRDLVKNGGSADEVNSSILALQGKHPHQEGGFKYYTNDKGVAIPLKNNEKPPSEYHVASAFGTAKDAKDDSFITDLVKTAYNILPSIAENAVDLAQTGYEAVTDESSETLNGLKNAANYLKFEKDPDIGGSLYDTKGIKSASDLLDTKRFDLSPKTIWGNALSLGQSVGEMLIPANTLSKGINGAKWAYKTADGITKLTTAGKAATIGTASFLTNHGEVKDAAERAGLKGRDLAIFSTLVTIPIAAIDTKLDLGSKIFQNASIKEEKDAFIKEAAKKVMEKTANGELSQKALDEAVKETLVTYPQIAKSWIKQAGKDALEQGGEESAQQFIQNAGEQVWDNLTHDEKAKFGTDAFSPESFGEYFQNLLAGSIGGGPTAFAFNAAKKKEQEFHKNSTVYGVVQQGDEAIKNFKRNVQNEKQQGELSDEEAQDAITRVNSFKEYNDITGSLNLNDEAKRESFDLTFQKQNLESKLEAMGNPEKMNPLELAQYDGLAKQSKDLQKKINEIILSAQVKEEPRVSDKTVNDITKASEKSKEEGKHPEAMNNLIKKFKDIESKTDERSYEEIPLHEYNSDKLNARVKQAKTVEYLEKQPNKTLVGALTERGYEYGNKKDKVIGVKLPDGKIIRLSSSKTRDEGFRGHFREEQLKTLTPDQYEGTPIAVKVEEVPADKEGETSKKAIKAYNTKTGKFVGWIKATNTGGNTKNKKAPEFSPKQIEHLQELEMVVEPPIEGDTTNSEALPEIHPVEGDVLQKQKDTKGSLEEEHHERILEVTKHIQKVLPKVKVVYDPKLQAAGQLKDNTIRINPYYAGIDTPIHEAAHVMLDAMGDNKVVKAAITQLKDTDLWKETAERYPELNEKGLANEVLAEAIGREGAGIFKDVTEQNQFMQYLNYIFDWLKRNLGLERNVAKNLARQIISGINTKNLISESQVEKNQIIGEKGAENIKNVKDNLAVAKEMDAAGEPTKTIYLATGWEKGFDGKWRYDLIENQDDFKIDEKELNKIIEITSASDWNDVTTTIGDMFPKANVLKAYPDLKNVKIVFYENKDQDQSASFIRKTDRINVNLQGRGNRAKDGGYSRDLHRLLRASLVHEIQHAIQHREGFERGGSPDTAPTKQLKEKLIKKIDKKISDFESRLPDITEEWTDNHDLIEKEIDKLKEEKISLSNRDLSYEAYRKISGEVEARNVEDRLNLTAEERKNTPISDTEEYDREDQLLNEKPNSTELSTSKPSKQFDEYREKKLDRNLNEIKENLDYIQDRLESDDLTDEEEEDLLRVKRGLNNEYREDRESYKQFMKGVDDVEKIANAKDLEGFSLDDLIESYNKARNYGGFADKEMLESVKLRIAQYMNETRREELRKFDKFIEEDANKKDLSWKNIWFKTLGHMTQDFPELQELSNLFDESFLDMQMDRQTKKKKLKKLADTVIKEKNKQLGLGERAKGLFSSDTAKYFEYMEKDGKYITDTSKLSEAQKNFLEYMKELTKERNLQDEDGNLIEDEIIKIDKGFQETYKDEGLFQAIGNYLGGNHADTEITYTNPLTNKAERVPYNEAEKAIIEYSKQGITQKALALTKILNIAYKAKKNAKGNSPYAISYNGQLTSKFDKPRDKNTGYSKDFYNAAIQYIDDITHVKHLSKFVPIVDSIEYLNENSYGEQLAKPNVVKWLKEWKDEQLYKKPKETDPIIDSSLRFLRTLTSQIVMGFNITASIMNVFVGNYNNWRADAAELGWGGLKSGLVGNKRFASKKGQALIDKYQVVNTDLDSYPKFNILHAFENLAYAAQKYGEMQIQGSMFLSQLTDKEWDSFEIKDGELHLKEGSDSKEIKKKFNQYKNRISDVQGKYSEKDRRNFMRGELGKIASQFKVWMPDAWKERFGSEYIDANNKVVKGTFRGLMDGSFAELRRQGKTKDYFTNKKAMANLKGAMLIAFILVMKYQNDDDEKKRRKALSLDNALGNLLFVFDTDQLKYLVKSPVASFGTVTKFIDVFQDVQKMDDKLGKDFIKIVPYGKAVTEVNNLIEEN